MLGHLGHPLVVPARLRDKGTRRLTGPPGRPRVWPSNRPVLGEGATPSDRVSGQRNDALVSHPDGQRGHCVCVVQSWGSQSKEVGSKVKMKEFCPRYTYRGSA